MATLQELERALFIADKKGDMDDARRLAFAIAEARKDVSNQIPGNPTLNTVPKAPEHSIGEKIVGAADTALTVGTAGTLGLAGQIGGTAKGAIEQFVYGNLGTQEGNNAIAQSAAEGAALGTFGPYTQEGQENVQAIGEALSQLPPIVGALRPVGAVSSGAKGAAMQAERLATKGVKGGVQLGKDAAQLGRDAGVVLKQKIDNVLPSKKAAPDAAVVEAPVEAPVVAEPMPRAELIKTAKKAAEGGLGSKKALGVLAEQVAPDPKTTAAAKRLGVANDLQADHVTTNQAYREYAQAVKLHPGSEARAKEIEGLDNIAKRADKLIEEIGGSHDLSQVNQNVKISLDSYQKQLDAEAEVHYGELRRNIPAKTRAPADKVLEFVNQRKADFDNNKEGLSSLETMVLKRLTPRRIKTKPQSSSLILDKTGQPARPRSEGAVLIKHPSYATLDDVRREIGAAAKGKGLFKDADTGLAKKLYALISEDQQRTAESAGMGETFKLAKSAVKARKEVEDNITGLFGKKQNLSIVGRLNASVRMLPTGDIAAFTKLLKGVPDDMKQEVVASSLLAAFGKTAKQGDFDFNAYVRWYEGVIKNKSAYEAIMKNLPKAARKQLSDLYRVSKAAAPSTKDRGRIQAAADEIKGVDSLITRVFDAAKHNAPSAAAGSITGMVGGPGIGVAIASALSKGPKPRSIVAADALISSPEFLQAIKLVGKGEPKKASKLLAHGTAFLKFSKAVGNSVKPGDMTDWIFKAIEGVETPDVALTSATALQAVRDNPNTQPTASRN